MGKAVLAGLDTVDRQKVDVLGNLVVTFVAAGSHGDRGIVGDIERGSFGIAVAENRTGRMHWDAE